MLSLPQRNLLRHLTWSIPSGQKIAKKVGTPVLTMDELAVGPIHTHFVKSTPLWYYVLREADLTTAARASARSAACSSAA